jgi:hypothetical protein
MADQSRPPELLFIQKTLYIFRHRQVVMAPIMRRFAMISEVLEVMSNVPSCNVK